jgi:hypothetical protein
VASTHAVLDRVAVAPRRRLDPTVTAFVESVTTRQDEDNLTPTTQRAEPDGAANQQPFTASPAPGPRGDDDQDVGFESNAMMGFVRNVDQTNSQPYNDSSVASFMTQIKRLVDQETSDSQTSPASSLKSLLRRYQYRKSSRRQEFLNYNLPSRQRADHLLSVYRRLVSTLYPFLDFEEIETLYLRLWTGEDLGEGGLTFVCLINVVFCLACNIDTTIAPQQRTSDAEVFYDRANELLQWNIVHEPSLLLVQCFLLLGQYLQSSDDPEQCWIFVGFAIRIAQSLRLDISSTSAKEPMQRRESMRRLWHGCILMDQVLSMTFGRPSMISSQASMSVPLPLSHSDGAHCRCSTEPENDVADYHFYIETLKLYQLMNETLSMLYISVAEPTSSHDTNLTFFGVSGPKLVGNMLEMDQKLSSWSRSLPCHIRHDTITDRGPMHQRQTNVLSIRYSHVRILLFRPILARYCSRGAVQTVNSTSGGDDLPEKIALQLSVACVKAALRIIEDFDTIVAGRQVEELDDLLPAWWYSIFYIYTAATVLVAARLDHSLLAEVTEQAIRESWVKAMRILSRYELFSKHAKRCSAALCLISNLVIQQTQQRGKLRERVGQELTPIPTASDAQGLQLVDESDSTVTAGVHTQDWWSNEQEFDRLRRKATTVENVVRHFNTSGIQVDVFGDMSWLTSMPSQQY